MKYSAKEDNFQTHGYPNLILDDLKSLMPEPL